jgi:prepilin-type N-terminal cleavage/methylation domain-containing protein
MKRKGFTLLEVTIVLALLGILMGVATVWTRTNLVNSQFQVSINEIKQSLLLTQNLSRQSFRDTTSGVAFAADSFTEFTASTYSSSDPDNYSVELPPSITISNIDFGGENEIYFEKFSGDPVATGGISLDHEDGRSATIDVDAEGNISVTMN